MKIFSFESELTNCGPLARQIEGESENKETVTSHLNNGLGWSRPTGCPKSKFAKVIGYIWRLVQARPKVGKAKMRLKNIHFTY